MHVAGGDVERAIGANTEDLSGPSFAVAVDPHSHVSDVCGAVLGHDHVVQRTDDVSGEVGVANQGAVRLQPENQAALHGNHDEPSVRQPPET